MRLSPLTTALLLCGAATAGAQASDGVPLQLASGSELSFDGTSTLHGFTCKTHDIQAFIKLNPAYKTDLRQLAHPIVSVQVVIPLKNLACGGELEGNMLKTLRAKEYPTITYVLNSYDSMPGTLTASSFTADTKGTLTIAGKDKETDMRVDASRLEDSLVTAAGTDTLKMTDFGIKPPRFMFGTLRVGDQIIVRFMLKATAKAVADARAALLTTAALPTAAP